ncbi:MAG: uracil-DNA glycosylase [Candidatus Pacebacteria bacterium]|nr:uracil-DNA glycosylase [Candidatus Paceibacterota bacterium]
MPKTEKLKEIKDEVLNLKRSPLYKERVKNKVFPVLGAGNHNAKIMFVGEAPGKNEAEQGRPFCGASGRVLDELLESIKMDRKDVYVTNIVKDRPTANRDPSLEEIKIYGPFLDRQIDIIQPKVIATLGRYSAEYIMKKFDLDFEIEPIGKMRGKAFGAKAPYGDIKIIPLLHPAVALYNSFSRDDLKKDFEILKNF